MHTSTKITNHKTNCRVLDNHKSSHFKCVVVNSIGYHMINFKCNKFGINQQNTKPAVVQFLISVNLSQTAQEKTYGWEKVEFSRPAPY